MYGLEAVARGSKSLMEKNAEAASIYFSDAYNRDDDERNWSFSYLREQLHLKNSHELFRRYQVRVQHALFVELLFFNVIYNAIALLAYIILPKKGYEDANADYGAIVTGRVCRSISLVVHFILFIASFKENLFRTLYSNIVAACLVLLCMTLGEMSTSAYRLYAGFPESIMRHTYYILLTTSVFLPFPRKLYCAMSGGAVVTLDLMLSSLSNANKKNLRIITMADFTFQATILSVGLGIRYLIEVMSRRAFLDRRECVESRMRTEMEKHQEDKFLQTILPNHIAKEVREDIWSVIKNFDIHITHKPFNKLYVEKHKGVSILYADIVNSMLLAANLKVVDLVETLNDLFGRFDDSAEKNGCMRIKLLGDCYYCVSGVPKKNPRHADNCVLTGLDMIDIIRSIREKRYVNVDMRIGVHSGNILGGLLGLRKWQFDIWSRDVTIASHMEQGGVPGQVHITRATKDQLQDSYDIHPGNGHLRDAYLQRERIETFLIKPKTKDTTEPLSSTSEIQERSEGVHFQRQVSATSRANIEKLSKRQSSNDSFLPMGRRGALGNNSLNRYRKMIKKVNEVMENTIDKMALSKKDQWFSNIGIQPLLLIFRERGHEWPFLNQPDPLFKYYLLCMLVIFIGITLIHLIILSSNSKFWISYGVLMLIILGACVPSWAGYIWQSIKADSDGVLDSKVLRVSRTVWKRTGLRISIWLTISFMILFCSLTGLNNCFDVHKTDKQPSLVPTNTTFSEEKLNCMYPWFYTLSAALAMTTTSVFLRVHFLMKFAVNVVSLTIFWYIMDFKGEEVFRQKSAKLAGWEEFGLPVDQSHCFFLTFVVLILHVLDRQIEYICRLDYLMKVKLREEQELTNNMEYVNRMLLFNILPPHVAKYYLHKQFEDDSQRIEATYHEERFSVAVLFASIPNYSDFYYEDSQNEEGLRCIQLLNEIICEFDLLLGESKFCSVEKIKTVGSTYMAACGLQSHESGSVVNVEDPIINVVTLVEFSAAMMASLQQLNQDAMQDFQLRIGISTGPVMAGVVGTVKPQFDIWGDTVNVASRMDSTGIIGRIQEQQQLNSHLSSQLGDWEETACFQSCNYELAISIALEDER